MAAGIAAAPSAAAEPFNAPPISGTLTAHGQVPVDAERRWRDVSAAFHAAAEATDSFHDAYDAAGALREERTSHGWSSPKVPGLVQAVLATAKPDGGYGLSGPWDAYQDGTVNPASTSYTATTAGHVGPVLLEGYVAGAVPVGAVNRAIDSILDTPRSMNGRCIPYSNSVYDLHMPCVWNTDYGAAQFVKDASAITRYRSADVDVMVASVTSLLTVYPADPRTGYWPYTSAGGGPQDIGHQVWTAESVDALTGKNAAISLMLSRNLWRSQAAQFHDYNVASAMATFALLDCRYASDPTVLAYAGGMARGTGAAYKALAAAADQVLATCFPPSTAKGRRTPKVSQRPPMQRTLVVPLL